jgi:hypothetical protein
MNYTIEMASGSMKFLLGFMKINTGIQSLSAGGCRHTHTHTHACGHTHTHRPR